ncbi:hypothetical protein SAMN05216188_106300 [Lentzea xinjiangensis]|uniref:Uncharacterized protein n=1 Tax=Lentzea xinjiangensis TaxID=402600 RepID=A0A1H9K5W6_9PSEU|nr:hypothetical protein [Lentzea xinjiangensis]SEQ94235.1 hypothetical protein SAMN05216188_106300 [Lentzea xinjiangensis]
MALDDGDALWYWNGNVSRTKNIPQAEWFGTSAPHDYDDHGWEISNFVVYAGEVAEGQPHMKGGKGSFSWLNNNPGNITAGGPAYGAFPGKVNWHNFLIFPSWDLGYDAIRQLLRGPGYAHLSILAAFQRYAPASDGNDPVRYANKVAAAVGRDVHTIVGDLTDDEMVEMQNAITDMEGAVAGWTYLRDDPALPQAVRDAIWS